MEFKITLTPTEGMLIVQALLAHELALEKSKTGLQDFFPGGVPAPVDGAVNDQQKLAGQIRARIKDRQTRTHECLDG